MCARRSGASASGSSRRSAATNCRRVAGAVPGGRRRQASTTEDASAFVPIPTIRFESSVRSGQVPVIEKPAPITASRKVSQPVRTVPPSLFVSACLKA